MVNLLLITPPLTQLNTPYPATTQLKGYLERNVKNCLVEQWDLSIELVCAIMSRGFLKKLFLTANLDNNLSSNSLEIYINKERYINTIDSTIKFLQGNDATLATRIASREFLPEASRFSIYDQQELEWAFGSSGTMDLAKHLATLYIQDLTDYIAETITSDFGLIRYAEQIALAAPLIDPTIEKINERNMIIDKMLSLLQDKLEQTKPDLVGFTIPFPGCLISTLQCCKYIKVHYPSIKIVIGGGYVNTELRQLSDNRVFNYVDYITFDDGEIPLELIVNNLDIEQNQKKELVRTMTSETISFGNKLTPVKDYTPNFKGLNFDKYISLLETANPMHRLWSDGKWNKVTMAHGCYWAKCAFCDTSLDYIKRYSPPTASKVVDTMEDVMSTTSQSGFHFTDEALPPKLLREVAQEIIRRGIIVSYWGNIRFEKSYDTELCNLLSQSGFIAASGGLEVASPRILKLINKGVTVEQAAHSMAAMTSNGIMVHSYLMYGFPTQTLQESIDSLEIVRQMFELGLIQSAFWHQFAMTAHSPIGMNPEHYGISSWDKATNTFANNGIDFKTTANYDLEALGDGLRKATYNFMHALGFDTSLNKWFDFKIPKTTLTPNYIETILADNKR